MTLIYSQIVKYRRNILKCDVYRSAKALHVYCKVVS